MTVLTHEEVKAIRLTYRNDLYELMRKTEEAVLTKLAARAAPTHVLAATSKTMQVLFATEADARKMQPTATSPFDVQRVPVFGAQAAPTKEQT